MSRLRRWCFTLNNSTDVEEFSLAEEEILALRYMVVGREVGEQGTPHLQGYVEFTGAMTLGQVKKALGTARLHAEACKGDGAANRAYCTKEGNLLCERGEMAKPGTRTDLKAVTAGLKGGGTIRKMIDDEVITSSSALRYAECVAKYVEAERDWLPEVRWYWGPPGAGKSRAAREWLDVVEDRYVKTSGSGKWWDGYDGHPDVLWDDFRDSQCPLTDLLGLLDRYGHRVEIKGGIRQCLARRIAITSVMPPETMFEHAKGEPVAQLLRRLSDVRHVQGCT